MHVPIGGINRLAIEECEYCAGLGVWLVHAHPPGQFYEPGAKGYFSDAHKIFRHEACSCHEVTAAVQG